MLLDRYKDHFRIEAGLNFYAIHYGSGLEYRVFRGISQTVKEAKFGFREGMRRRLAMFGEVLGAAWDLQRHDLPDTDRARRSAAGMVALTAVGMLIGLLVLAAGIAGPVSFTRGLFSDELSEDPGAPFVNLLLGIVGAVSASALVLTGAVLLASNAMFFLRSLVRLVTVGRVRHSG